MIAMELFCKIQASQPFDCNIVKLRASYTTLNQNYSHFAEIQLIRWISNWILLRLSVICRNIRIHLIHYVDVWKTLAKHINWRNVLIDQQKYIKLFSGIKKASTSIIEFKFIEEEYEILQFLKHRSRTLESFNNTELHKSRFNVGIVVL